MLQQKTILFALKPEGATSRCGGQLCMHAERHTLQLVNQQFGVALCSTVECQVGGETTGESHAFVCAAASAALLQELSVLYY